MVWNVYSGEISPKESGRQSKRSFYDLFLPLLWGISGSNKRIQRRSLPQVWRASNHPLMVPEEVIPWDVFMVIRMFGLSRLTIIGEIYWSYPRCSAMR